MEATIERTTIQEQVGELLYTVDVETGEILSAERPGFHVEDEKSAEWLLERLQEQDAQIAALSARRAAILENIETEIKRIQNRRSGLLYKYENELVEVAKANLPTGKKSWVCPYGTVQFRTNPARLRVDDPEVALNWAKAFEPESVKVVEEFQISKLSADRKSSLMAFMPNELKERGFEVAPESETHSISTGVK